MKALPVVFTGPTLTAVDAREILECVTLPPARQGDVWRAVSDHRPVALGLIDGVFLHQPAVWHREILWALSCGVHVFGAASMGALRAAELAPFGMVGVGKVFAAFRDGVWPGFSEDFEDDDEVAVIHAPKEMDLRALSDAMVDLRDTLLAAETAGVINRDTRDHLAAAMKRLPFPERSIAALSRVATDTAGAHALAEWLPVGRVPRKRLDALAMLKEMAGFLATDPPPFQAEFRLAHPQTWEDFLSAAEPALTLEEAMVLDEVRLNPTVWWDAARAALGRLYAVPAAPFSPPEAEHKAFDTWRRALGLMRRIDVDAWLAANAVSPATLTRLLTHEAALVATLNAPPPGLSIAIADHLRLSGQFAALLTRARTKSAALSHLSVPASGPGMDAALAWFAERHGGWQGGSQSHVSCWPNEKYFRVAVWREYVFSAKGVL